MTSNPHYARATAASSILRSRLPGLHRTGPRAAVPAPRDLRRDRIALTLHKRLAGADAAPLHAEGRVGFVPLAALEPRSAA
ncbi:hypothetical protein AB0D54_18610 [Streptomyces xanthophaeus]|uniref:hypothetical protein n=1 Tax=Streptomyces xanthophaeus TaxID=67385 RepID=UPI0034335A82